MRTCERIRSRIDERINWILLLYLSLDKTQYSVLKLAAHRWLSSKLSILSDISIAGLCWLVYVVRKIMYPSTTRRLKVIFFVSLVIFVDLVDVRYWFLSHVNRYFLSLFFSYYFGPKFVIYIVSLEQFRSCELIWFFASIFREETFR